MKLRRNLFHLFLWQGSNYLIPLIVIPYLARSLGLQGYGAFGLALAVTNYGVLLTDWGFNLSATQKVARALGDQDKLRLLFWDTMLARCILAILALIALALATAIFPIFRGMWQIILASSMVILSTALSANFFLQGMQQMGAFAASAMVGRLSIIPLMLQFVHGPKDVVIAALIQNGTQLLSAVISLIISARLVQLSPVDLNLKASTRQIRDGWQQFVSAISVSLYVQTNSVVVGFVAGTAQAGLLTGSQRFTQAFQQLLTPINMSVYPQVNLLSYSNPPGAVRLMFKTLKLQPLVGIVLSVSLFFAAPFFVPLVLGEAFRAAIPVTRLLALMPFLSSVTTVLGGNIMLPLGFKGPYTTCLLLGGLFNIGLLVYFVPKFGAVGGATAAIATELFLILAFGSTLYAKRSVFERMNAGERP